MHVNVSIYSDSAGYYQWSNCGGTRGNGVPLPFFWRGNAVPLAYTTTATYNTSNRKKCALNALFKVTPIVNRGNFKSCIL